jgi:hypothetical protein
MKTLLLVVLASTAALTAADAPMSALYKTGAGGAATIQNGTSRHV